MLYEYQHRIAMAVSFHYGSNHNDRELDYAKLHCERLGIPHMVIRLPFVKQFFRSSLLEGADAIPEQAYNYCDSVIHLHLKVNPTYDIDIYDTICEGSARWFNNIERRESGLYTYRGQTKAGCDSIVTLHLSVIAKQTAYIEHHLCVGDFVEIDGQRVTTSGTYPVYSTSSRGCDSTTIWRVITDLYARQHIHRYAPYAERM